MTNTFDESNKWLGRLVLATVMVLLAAVTGFVHESASFALVALALLGLMFFSIDFVFGPQIGSLSSYFGVVLLALFIPFALGAGLTYYF